MKKQRYSNLLYVLHLTLSFVLGVLILGLILLSELPLFGANLSPMTTYFILAACLLLVCFVYSLYVKYRRYAVIVSTIYAAGMLALIVFPSHFIVSPVSTFEFVAGILFSYPGMALMLSMAVMYLYTFDKTRKF